MTKKSDKTRVIKGPLFVYGLDEFGKPRGAKFAEVRDDVLKAVTSIGCLTVQDPPPAFAEHAVKLPLGRIYSSGKVFVPNLRRVLYDKLVEAGKALGLGAPPPPKPAKDQALTAPATYSPKDPPTEADHPRKAGFRSGTRFDLCRRD